MSDKLEGFWGAARHSNLVILTDFDYTISQVDVGDLMTETFSPPSQETLDRFGRQEIGSRLYWLDSMVRVDPERAVAAADKVAIDPTFPDFVAWCRSQQIPIAVVSDGFGFYIRRILGREGLGNLPVFCNELPRRGDILYPHANPACDFCGCCKANIARQVNGSGAQVVYVGDGVSDLYAARFADWVFAKARLASYMAEQGASYFPLTSFARVQQELASQLELYRSGEAPGRARLDPDTRCRFPDTPLEYRQ